MIEKNSLRRGAERRCTTGVLDLAIADFIQKLASQERVSDRHALETLVECGISLLAEELRSHKAARRYAAKVTRVFGAKAKSWKP